MNGGGEALGIDVAYAAPKFGEALQRLRKGETAVLWMPPGEGMPETVVYEVAVVDIKSPTATASRSPVTKTGQDGASTQKSATSMQKQEAMSPPQQAAVAQPQP